MEIKVLCPCGAKYQFPVEPVNGQLPRAIAYPLCGVDNTELGNQVIQEALSRPVVPAVLVATPDPSAPPAPVTPRAVAPPPPAMAGGLRLSASSPAPPSHSSAPPPPRVPPARYTQTSASER